MTETNQNPEETPETGASVGDETVAEVSTPITDDVASETPAPPTAADAPDPTPPADEPPAATDAAETPTEEPAADAPAAETPAEAPVAEAPATEAPAAETPTEEPAPAAAPAAEPVAEAPAAETPTEEPAPAAEPVAEAPAAETPAAEPAAEEPAAEATAAEAPTEEPAAEAPATETPTEAPAAPADPTAGLGLPESGALLGPPNLGGFESGEIVSGTVLTVTKREAEVDLGNGKVGVVTDRHWSSGRQVDLTSVVKTGDAVEGAVLARADAKKRITISRLWAQQKIGWGEAEAAAKSNGNLTGTVTETVKGGLSLDVNGVRAFMPASLVDLHTVEDLKPYIGQTFDVRVIEADRNKARLIVSRKAAMRASERQQAKAALSGFEVGQKLDGKVAQITDFGAFVDVNGVRGLVHKSEIGWSRARDPQRDLKVGQEVEVRVLKVQASRNRLGLSMRLGEDPLRAVKKGDRFEATVNRLVDFGAFVEAPGGLEGLVHVSEMAEYRVFAPEEIVIPGDKVWVKVLKIDRKRRTLDLSMAQAIVPDPPEEEAAREAARARAEEDRAKQTAAADAPASEAAEVAEAPGAEAAESTEPAATTETAAPASDDYAEDGGAPAASDAASEEE